MGHGISRCAWVLAVAGALAGCSSSGERIAWDERGPVSTPTAPEPAGFLKVETPEGYRSGDDVHLRHPFALHGADGAFLSNFPNEYAQPVRLPPGRYVVVAALPGGRRKVHVEIADGATTVVRPGDLDRGSPVSLP